MNLPKLQHLDLSSCPLYKGYYSLGLIQQCFPDIDLVPYRLDRHDQWTESDINVDVLDSRIKQGLQTHKAVFIVPWEEDFMGQPDPAFTDMLNQYANHAVFLLSEMSQQGQLLYRFQHSLQAKLVELPFVLVNDAICYWAVASQSDLCPPPQCTETYLCMIGRGQEHKYNLVQNLVKHSLQAYGTITRSNNQVPDYIKQHTKLNHHSPRYQTHELLTACRKEAAQIKINNIWVSSNVANYLHLEQTYDHPLIINVESTLGIFPATEKSLWPSLLGRIPLIYGPGKVMQWIQRFSDFDFSQVINLEFDCVEGYDEVAYNTRLEKMIVENYDLICHARSVYRQHANALQLNRQQFVQNLYSFFCQQVQDTIKMV